MCYQLDIYRNSSERSKDLHPYLLVIQHDYYDDLSTRLILPISYRRYLNGKNHPVTPLINIEFQSLFLNTPCITSVEKVKLKNKNFVCNMPSARTQIVAAIDALVTNT